MVSERPARRLNDVLENIARIRSHVRGMNEAAFLQDIKTIDAVERCFERIAEAMRKIGPRYDAVYPDLALPDLRGFGSVLRHDYESIEPPRLWIFATVEVVLLEAMARMELAKLPAEGEG
ncbi:MAG: hypothetical protein COW30_12335 [Rhodospirillales bacterium CG15_BIG_FIL_POST_REV_8_21_14_020_66_15]|nr:MAG: hypothetical protein COW30_12335 [Rhodospirillales bacterium CG15_BIG_FIL_POST_REV_8_21_14_020_66_15]